jgi:hypothetical protein
MLLGHKNYSHFSEEEEWGMGNLDRTFLIAGLISLSFLIGISCGGGKAGERDNKPTKQKIESTLKEHQWKISNFHDQKDETHHFKGYSFQFNRNGSVVASNSNTIVTGTWSTFNSGNGQLKLSVEFTLIEPFDELSDDWVIVENADDKIILNEGNTDPENADIVIFEKV